MFRRDPSVLELSNQFDSFWHHFILPSWSINFKDCRRGFFGNEYTISSPWTVFELEECHPGPFTKKKNVQHWQPTTDWYLFIFTYVYNLLYIQFKPPSTKPFKIWMKSWKLKTFRISSTWTKSRGKERRMITLPSARPTALDPTSARSVTFLSLQVIPCAIIKRRSIWCVSTWRLIV